jgi:hypothetical protein
MHRANAALIALVLGAAVVIGSMAALKTAELKSASAKPAVSARVIARRNARLDRAEIALRKALGRKPPKLPAVPHYPAVSSPQVSAAGPAPAPPVVRYVRPAPIVVTTHHAGGDEGEYEHEGGDHEGGGGDD